MGKMSVNEVKHFDKIQESLEELKKPKFKNLGEYGRHIKSLSNPHRDQKAIIVYSILDMIESQKHAWGEMNNDKLIAIIAPIARETGLNTSELLRILMHLLIDSQYFVKISSDFKKVFEANSH